MFKVKTAIVLALSLFLVEGCTKKTASAKDEKEALFEQYMAAGDSYSAIEKYCDGVANKIAAEYTEVVFGPKSNTLSLKFQAELQKAGNEAFADVKKDYKEKMLEVLLTHDIAQEIKDSESTLSKSVRMKLKRAGSNDSTGALLEFRRTATAEKLGKERIQLAIQLTHAVQTFDIDVAMTVAIKDGLTKGILSIAPEFAGNQPDKDQKAAMVAEMLEEARVSHVYFYLYALQELTDSELKQLVESASHPYDQRFNAAEKEANVYALSRASEKFGKSIATEIKLLKQAFVPNSSKK